MGYNLEWYNGVRRKLTLELVAHIKLCGFMFKSIEESCRYCGITSNTYRNWMKDAEADLDENGEIQDEILRQFYDAHERGRQERIDEIAVNVLNSSKLDADLGLKVLERQSKQWSNKVEQKISMNSDSTIKHEFSGLTLEEKKEAIEAILKKEAEQKK